MTKEVIIILIITLIYIGVLIYILNTRGVKSKKICNEYRESILTDSEVVVRPVFTIIYSKEELSDSDIDTIAKMVLNFDSINNLSYEEVEDDDKIFVKFNNVNINQYFNLKV